MNWFIREYRLLVGLVLIAVLSVACLDDKYEGQKSDAEADMQAYLDANGYAGNSIYIDGYGTYIKILNNPNPDADKPEYGNSVVLEFTGKYTDGTIFETTDEALSNGLTYADYYIYGPKKLIVGTLIPGFDAAIKEMPEGSSAEMVISYQYAFGSFKNVVYKVDLLKVIDNDTTYEAELFDDFFVENEFNKEDTLTREFYYKYENTSDSIRSDTFDFVSVGDSLVIELTASFAETFENGDPARVFYPRSFESKTIDYYWGTDDYPITSAIDTAVKYMRVGQTMEIAFKSGAEADAGYSWGYGSEGLIDPDINYYMIAPYTPLTYKIKLLYAEGYDY